jgi:PKD repeat protein
MKKIILLTGISLVLFASCVHEYLPTANFTANNTLVIPDEVVFFSNTSSHADYFEWDFGDGYVSTDPNPSHYFSEEGVYEVRLAAHSNGNVNYAYLQIEVYETTLEIEVREFYSNDLIPNVAITLYPTYDDWLNLTNDIITASTDSYGVVIFKGLNTSRYYIDAYNAYYGNEDLGFEDIGFIETLPLEYATHNLFTAKVDYYPPNGKISTSDENGNRIRKPVIKEFKRVYKENTVTVK